MELEKIDDDYFIGHYRGSKINVRRQADGTWRATAKVPGSRNWRIMSPCLTQNESVRIVCSRLDDECRPDEESKPTPVVPIGGDELGF